jgi:hypothetical protein
MVFEIALGILLGYLLIMSLPYFIYGLVILWNFKLKVFLILLSIGGYLIFFLDGRDSTLALISGAIGLISLFLALYSFDSEEDSKRSFKNFIKWFKK